MFIYSILYTQKKSILSQANILNIFPASVPLLSVTKVLQANCIRKTLRYVPINLLWINKLANESENVCLANDCSSFNPNGPVRFTRKADNSVSQTCYFNVSNDDQMFSVFIKTCTSSEEGENKILFQIDGIKSKTNNEIFYAKLELENVAQNDSTDDGQTQNRFGIFNTSGEKYARKFRLRTIRKSARPKFMLRQ